MVYFENGEILIRDMVPGAAQRMYVKRGYIPDGSGVWYGANVCPQYENCCNDDDLVLFFSKKLM